MRNKVYSFINITGLSVGLMVSILIIMFVIHELNFDKFHINGNRIYHVNSKVKYGDQEVNISAMTAQLAPIVKELNDEVLDYVRAINTGEVVFKNTQSLNQKFKETGILFVDKSFFSVFSFKLKEGSSLTNFKNPFSLVISEKAAKKYFGDENPIGKTLLCDAKHLFTVTSVMYDVPSNSSMNFDFVSSIETYPKLGDAQKNAWEKAGSFQTYLLLNSEKAVSKIEKNIAENGSKTHAFDSKATYFLTQYASQHLQGGFSENKNARYTYIFAAIALLILFLALFNYMSLTTARSTTRAKEVGVRKVIGSSRKDLIYQFYLESILVCAIAFSLAMILIKFLLPTFYDLSNVKIDPSFIISPIFLTAVFVLFIICSLLAGSYPALLLSKFAPIEVLKGRYASGEGGKTLRKGITVFQFAVSSILIIAVIIIHEQVNYLKNKDLGFTQSQILAIPIDSSMSNGFIGFKNDIRQLSGVKSITSTTTPLYKGVNAWFTNSVKSKKETLLFSITTDENFFETIDLTWTKPPVNRDNLDKKIFINETAAKKLELEDNPVGQFIELGDSKSEVGGVLKDFHFTGLREEISPLSIIVYPENAINWASGGGISTVYVRFQHSTLLPEKVETVKSLYEKYASEKPFEYYFLDEAFNETFKSEIRLSSMLSVFSAFAIFIACMGLFGLVAFAAEMRTKEISIRKVLGASVTQIAILLTKDFIKLILVAFAIAAPLAWYGMHKWLQDFPFRITIGWNVFAWAGIATLIIALLTVSFQAIKAAVANPVKSLRTE